jgi:hypothetical protein
MRWYVMRIKQQYESVWKLSSQILQLSFKTESDAENAEPIKEISSSGEFSEMWQDLVVLLFVPADLFDVLALCRLELADGRTAAGLFRYIIHSLSSSLYSCYPFLPSYSWFTSSYISCFVLPPLLSSHLSSHFPFLLYSNKTKQSP